MQFFRRATYHTCVFNLGCVGACKYLFHPGLIQLYYKYIVCIDTIYTEKHTQGETLMKKNFDKLKNLQICGNKVHKRLRLSKETITDDKI